MRNNVLERWVKQPPAEPNVQYLRDAERITAWEQLGERDAVLDVASEANVTAGLDAERVTRLDFSGKSIEYAREILGDQVDRYDWVEPGDPRLPFADDAFDAAVSIGPFDWKFLDVETLTDELERVVADDGLLVFSVPTPRSPYSVRNGNEFRYFDPDEALSLLSPDWRLADYDLVFQYPFYTHYGLNCLPDPLQKPFVEVAWRLTDYLTEHDRWDDAAYLVLGGEPMGYEGYLDDALDCLFRPAEENGFWDPDEGKIIRALEYEVESDGSSATSDPSFTWSREHHNEWRYAPFALMGAMQWRTSGLGVTDYDAKLRSALEHFRGLVADGTVQSEMPSYGVGPLVESFALAADVFDDAYADTAYTLYEHSRDPTAFDHAEDSLLAYGWATLAEQTEDLDRREAIRDDLDDALWEINDRISAEGLFAFDNGTTRRHQNQMYSLWGLCRAIEVTDRPGYLSSAEEVLDYTVEHRMQENGAFVWEDVERLREYKREAAKRVGFRPPHWDFLYACHQTFFVNAVSTYYAAGGTKDYDREVRRAMEWVYGHNELDADLVEFGGLGVPMRQCTVDGRIDVPDQMYKGSYEVGSYLMALTNLLDGPFERLGERRDRGSLAGHDVASRRSRQDREPASTPAPNPRPDGGDR
ncbi:class I SAM-dependent methyltransferase [Halospeciosus flavus]|uniref:Class I SAM-dependent methyltransferase n=1 Tax=Halospeciosus flavus TaxID=3032283 RepID=A0ABD5Z102_9EURY|nr:methyltransferase domain-containing protein [Halospeciosus flavus]